MPQPTQQSTKLQSTGIEEVNSVNPIAQIRPAVGASAGVHVNSANPTSKENHRKNKQ